MWPCLLCSDIDLIHDGIASDLGMACRWLSGCFAALFVGLILGWKLALVIIALTPLMAIIGSIATAVMSLFFILPSSYFI